MGNVKEIVEATITFVSLVGKGANGKDFLIVKSEEAAPSLLKQTPLIKIDEEKRLVTGIVYEPDTIDTQGEFMRAEAIEKAAHNFLSNYRNIDKAHTFQAENAQVVESYVAKADHEIEGTTIKKGTWLLTTHIEDDEIWEQVKKGELNAYSMGGTGERVEHLETEAEAVEKLSDENKEIRGFFNVLKDFFGVPASTTKAVNEKKPTDFTSVIDSSKIDENLSTARWTLSDVMRNILLDSTISDKATAISAQIDTFKAYILGQLKEVGIQKAAEMLSEPLEKTGRKISTERLNHIKAAHAALQSILSEVETSEEGETVNMKKEELSELLKENLAPIVVDGGRYIYLEEPHSYAKYNEYDSSKDKAKNLLIETAYDLGLELIKRYEAYKNLDDVVINEYEIVRNNTYSAEEFFARAKSLDFNDREGFMELWKKQLDNLFKNTTINLEPLEGFASDLNYYERGNYMKNTMGLLFTPAEVCEALGLSDESDYDDELDAPCAIEVAADMLSGVVSFTRRELERLAAYKGLTVTELEKFV